MEWLHIVGLTIAVALIAFLAVYSGTKSKKSKKENGSAIVAGVIMGTLVGGSSTVGTAQLAYNFGMSAWWFTLGGGIACLILALAYVKPLRSQNSPTLVGMIRNEYGAAAGMSASVLNAVGTFINIISQLLAASAVVIVVLPTMGTFLTVLISGAFMALYVIFGGTKGAGMVGVLKLCLLYVSMLACGMAVLGKVDGAVGFIDMVNQMSRETGVNYFNILCRGAGKDLGSCLSLVLGVLTTQTYAQAVLSGKSDNASRKGALVSAVLIPPIGICGILVGLYMRSITDPTVFAAKTALTQFAIDNLPPLLGGIVLGTLFIASVGTGAGLALGIATIINKDIISKFTNKFDGNRANQVLSKMLIVIVLLVGCCFSTGNLGDTILNFAFMSMGLRGAVVFVPLCFLLWSSRKIDNRYALASIIAGPVITFIFGTILSGILPFDSLSAGIIVDAVIMSVGFFASKQKKL